MKQEDRIEVLYNNWPHGNGWGISYEAFDLYNLKMLQKDPNFKPLLNEEKRSFEDNVERHNPILVEIYHEIGASMSCSYCQIVVETIPKRYENYYKITEYDNVEIVEIDEYKYQYDTLKFTLKEILIDNTISSDDKISKVMKTLDSENVFF
jgi:hypothetical protein